MAEIVLQNPPALLLLPLLWLVIVMVAWRRRFKPFGAFLLRLAVIVLGVAALSQPIWIPAGVEPDTPPEELVILVDHSASIPEAMQQRFQTEVARLLEQRPEATVLAFSDQAVVGADKKNLLNPEISNLAQALQTGGQMLAGREGRLALFSDGYPTTGDTTSAIDRLEDQNIPVDVFMPDAADSVQANDVRLIDFDVPDHLREGEDFDVELFIHSQQSTEARLKLWQDDENLNQNTVSLDAGLTRFTFPVTAGEVGTHTFQAVIAAANDAQPINNASAAFTQVSPAPQILVVGDSPAETSAFAGWLEQDGFAPTTIRPADLPNRLSELEPYAGMVMLNVSARPLELEQMIAVQEFVRSLGRGLLVTGGRNSFSLGNYEDTPLAQLLPVSLDPPAREERPPVALLLIIDHSGSMVEERGDLGTRLVMAKEAAIRAINILAPQDLIGILIFDTDYKWIVPFRQVSDGAALLQIQEDISAIQPGSATRILAALQEGIPTLIDQEVASAARHVVLFSDGTSYDVRDATDPDNPVPDYDAIVDTALAGDITLSTVSIGGDTDENLMARLAERGRGRFHYAGSPDELPELTIAESDILRSNAVQEGDYSVAAAAPHPVIRGFAANCSDPECRETDGKPIPPLTGYIAMTPKPQAELALQIGPGDPLLGVWGYGLGRVAAWSSDIGTEWAANWQAWPDAADYWGQVVDYTLPASGLGLLQLQAEVQPDGVVILTAEGVTSNGQTVDLSRTAAVLTTPGGRDIPLNLRQIAPGRYQQQVKVADMGLYQLQVTQSREDQPAETAIIGFNVPYPEEYALPDDTGGRPLLQQIAGSTGGQAFGPDGLVITADSAEKSDNLGLEPSDLWPWLLLLALILWPLEIAWRRWGRLRIN